MPKRSIVEQAKRTAAAADAFAGAMLGDMPKAKKRPQKQVPDYVTRTNRIGLIGHNVEIRIEPTDPTVRGVRTLITLLEGRAPVTQYCEVLGGKQRGPWLTVRPAAWELLKQQRDDATEYSKRLRRLRTIERNREAPRKTRGEIRDDAAEIVAAYNALSHLRKHNRASVVAVKLGKHVRKVRRAIARAKKTDTLRK